jgi:hypothetical protein
VPAIYLHQGRFHRISSQYSDPTGNDGSTFICDLSSGTYIYQNGPLREIASARASEFA